MYQKFGCSVFIAVRPTLASSSTFNLAKSWLIRANQLIRGEKKKREKEERIERAEIIKSDRISMPDNMHSVLMHEKKRERKIMQSVQLANERYGAS